MKTAYKSTFRNDLAKFPEKICTKIFELIDVVERTDSLERKERCAKHRKFTESLSNGIILPTSAL